MMQSIVRTFIADIAKDTIIEQRDSCITVVPTNQVADQVGRCRKEHERDRGMTSFW